MANNAFATRSGGEIGVAQAIQAFACGLEPSVEMNPVLLKPVGSQGSQIVRLGKAGEVLHAREYYNAISDARSLVHDTLDYWQSHCDVLVMEGAGSPVELNLMERDIVNLDPVRHTDGRWILVGNIEKGGVFAQIVGTWQLMPDADKSRGLGFIVNQFRGDISLFENAVPHFQKHTQLPYLGVLPFDSDAHLEDEDSMSAQIGRPSGDKPYIAWIRYPRVANSQDQLPWKNDQGIEHIWTDRISDLKHAEAIILPGSKNTLSDLEWLKERGIAKTLQELSEANKPVLGICGGFQILGEQLINQEDGEGEIVEGLGLLPHVTTFFQEKRVIRHRSRLGESTWDTFEIHTGQSSLSGGQDWQPLFEIETETKSWEPEGMRCGNVWGTYQHGLFESPAMRCKFLDHCGLSSEGVNQVDWESAREETFTRMAHLLEQYLDLDQIRRYLDLPGE